MLMEAKKVRMVEEEQDGDEDGDRGVANAKIDKRRV
jgi:hypothetical protein